MAVDSDARIGAFSCTPFLRHVVSAALPHSVHTRYNWLQTAPLSASYCLASEYLGGALFATGGRGGGLKKSTINAWDLRREYCVAQLLSDDADSGPVEHLAASSSSPLLYAGDVAGLVRMYDLRTSSPVGTLHPVKDRLAGLAAEPGRMAHQLVLAYRNGSISFADCRMAGSTVEASLWKSIEGHSKGNVTTVCGHSSAPLFATATASQVVKVWSMGGEQVGVVRAHTSFLSQRIGPVTCLAFAPYSLTLASGGGDSICAVYSLDLGRPPAAPRPT